MAFPGKHEIGRDHKARLQTKAGTLDELLNGTYCFLDATRPLTKPCFHIEQ